MTDRAVLLDKDKKGAGAAAAAPKGGENEEPSQKKEDKDVLLLKKRIKANLDEQVEMVKERRFIIVSSRNKFLNYFEYLVMTLAIWNACWTPLTISFERAKEIGGSVGFVIIDECVNAIFWMDIFL